MPNQEQQPQEVYTNLVESIQKIVCPHEDMFENATVFNVDNIREQINHLLKKLDSGLIVNVKVSRGDHQAVLNAIPGPAAIKDLAGRIYLFCSYNDDEQLTRISARQCPNENERNAFSFDLVVAERRVNYIRRYCPAAPTVNQKRDSLILDSISALSACLNSHISLKGERLFDLAAFDELLYQWCEHYGQYQYLEAIVGKTLDNGVACMLYTQHPKTFNSGFMIEQFKNNVLIENGNIDNGRHTTRLKIDPASLPDQCKIVHLKADAREIISASQVANIPPQNKSLYNINRYTVKQMEKERGTSLGAVASTLFAVAAIPAVMYGVGICWRSLNNK